MRGLMRPGDRVRVESAGVEELRFGDIVVFITEEPYRRGMLSAHRLLWRSRGPRGWTLWTKGDAQFLLDAPSPEESFVGRVVAVQRAGAEWIELTGARAVWHRALGTASLPLALRSHALAALRRLLRLAAGPRWLRPARRVLQRLAVLCEDL
jgi:hypothetical protein